MGIDLRATVDLDATLKGSELNESEVVAMINEIIGISLDDASGFSLAGVEHTRVEADYPGWRITLKATFDSIRDTLKLDITVGDIITPRAIDYSYKLMFEDKSINISAYSMETILAEKFTACISLGTSNTRMKDYYDIYILTTTYSNDISNDVFKEALQRTAKQCRIPLSESGLVISEIADSLVMENLWKRYQTDENYAAGIKFNETVNGLRTLGKWAGLIVSRNKDNPNPKTLMAELAEAHKISNKKMMCVTITPSVKKGSEVNI